MRLVLLNAALVVGAMALAALAPRAGRHVAVVVPPGSDPAAAMTAVAAAGGRLVAATGRDWIVVADGTGDDFVDRLYAAGAVLVMDPAGLFGCRSE
jgi:hypothetical protein